MKSKGLYVKNHYFIIHKNKQITSTYMDISNKPKNTIDWVHVYFVYQMLNYEFSDI